jgi:Rhodopirellula transposase DDE domain
MRAPRDYFTGWPVRGSLRWVDTHTVLETAFSLVLPHLTERQRRLVLGAVARALGRGGVMRVAELAGSSRPTVRRGMAELDEPPDPGGRVRRPGGGPKRLRDTNPGLLAALEALIDGGDPAGPLRWTSSSARQLADALGEVGYRVSDDTVSRLLRQEGYRPRPTGGLARGSRRPERDAQVRYLNQQVLSHLSAGQPVVAVAAGKQRLVGRPIDEGARAAGEVVELCVHGLPDPADGVSPDARGGASLAEVAADDDTVGFAVQTLRRWWNAMGKDACPHADRLCVVVDLGGGKDRHLPAWTGGLARLAAETGLAITVCHLPLGISRWDRVAQRLSSHTWIRRHRRPPARHQVVVELIGATPTGPTPSARGYRDADLPGAGPGRQEVAAPIDRHRFHGEWNYTIRPGPAPPPSGGGAPTARR